MNALARDGRREHGRLSSPLRMLKSHYDVVVVGSGYGGSVTAARRAQRGEDVCILERGRELQPGDYPDTLPRALREFQVDLPDRHLFSPTGLYDLRVNPDLNVFVGCGLGGTSLINAGVVLCPRAEVFEDERWPAAIRDEARTNRLWHWFNVAQWRLGANVLPSTERPRKVEALKSVGTHVGGRFRRVPVAVAFRHEVRARPAAALHGCTSCGDCVSGCNYGAKKTLIAPHSYLSLARDNAAHIFTETKVQSVQEGPGDPRRWIVHFEQLGAGRDRFAAPSLFVTARTVILAAGALGSPEILMRSQAERGLRLSTELGKHFSGNGDVLAFSYNNRERVNAIGLGRRAARGGDPPGPCISGYVELPGALVEDGVIPGALSPILTLGFMLARLSGRQPPAARREQRPGRRPPAARRDLSLWRLLEDRLRGGLQSTHTFLAMVDDPGYGELIRQNGRLRVRWPGAGRGGAYAKLEGLLQDAADELDGAYVPSPFGPTTVHPLGGCVMGDDPSRGVVDHTGAVYDPERPELGHPGLYVCDASIIPVALRTNPLLTITALAERTAEAIPDGAPRPVH